jgi:DNA polymerase II small subunit
MNLKALELLDMNESLQKTVKGIDTTMVVKKFLVRGFNVSPEAAKMVVSFSDPDLLIAEVCKISKNKFIICEEDVLMALKNLEKAPKKREVTKEDKKEEKIERVKILKDVNNSFVQGTIEDFVAYFNSRLEKIGRIFRGRVHSVKIKDLGRIRGENVSVIGMVNNVFDRKESVVIELEDQTGTINCIASGKCAEVARELLGDEVIAVTGTLKGSSMIVDRIVFPDCPTNGERKPIDFGVVFISDTHFGSKGFLEDSWKHFIEWLNCESENAELNKIAEKVKYLIVAGDIVDGVGVYPDQEKELAIIDVYEQYEVAAMHLDDIRKDITVLISPGNHDAVRQAEPQPCLPKEFSKLFPSNVRNLGNPAFVELEGLRVLIYHGRSLDDLVTKIPRLSYEYPHKAMEELLKRRHLCPLYGGRSPIAPSKEDLLVIDEVPDVLHSGHVHTYGTGFYRGVFLVNSSTWQAQTEFQKKINLNPMPCNVAVYFGDKVYRINFGGG